MHSKAGALTLGCNQLLNWAFFASTFKGVEGERVINGGMEIIALVRFSARSECEKDDGKGFR